MPACRSRSRVIRGMCSGLRMTSRPCRCLIRMRRAVFNRFQAGSSLPGRTGLMRGRPLIRSCSWPGLPLEQVPAPVLTGIWIAVPLPARSCTLPDTGLYSRRFMGSMSAKSVCPAFVNCPRAVIVVRSNRVMDLAEQGLLGYLYKSRSLPGPPSPDPGLYCATQGSRSGSVQPPLPAGWVEKRFGAEAVCRVCRA